MCVCLMGAVECVLRRRDAPDEGAVLDALQPGGKADAFQPATSGKGAALNGLEADREGDGLEAAAVVEAGFPDRTIVGQRELLQAVTIHEAAGSDRDE